LFCFLRSLVVFGLEIRRSLVLSFVLFGLSLSRLCIADELDLIFRLNTGEDAFLRAGNVSFNSETMLGTGVIEPDPDKPFPCTFAPLDVCPYPWFPKIPTWWVKVEAFKRFWQDPSLFGFDVSPRPDLIPSGNGSFQMRFPMGELATGTMVSQGENEPFVIDADFSLVGDNPTILEGEEIRSRETFTLSDDRREILGVGDVSVNNVILAEFIARYELPQVADDPIPVPSNPALSIDSLMNLEFSDERIMFSGPVTVSAGMLGDFDGNRTLTAQDIDLLSGHVTYKPNPDDPFHPCNLPIPPRWCWFVVSEDYLDQNDDGSLDQIDRTIWVKDHKGTWFGDADLNGQFDTADLVAVFQIGEYEDLVPHNSSWSEGDWDGNGDFEMSDFIFALQDGGYERGSLLARAVPEPSHMAIVITGIGGLLWLGNSRRCDTRHRLSGSIRGWRIAQTAFSDERTRMRLRGRDSGKSMKLTPVTCCVSSLYVAAVRPRSNARTAGFCRSQ
jgi:hypothetical protein